MKSKKQNKEINLNVLADQEMAIVIFTEALARAMREQNISRAELAKRINVSASYVTQVLGGTNNFSFRTAVALAHALNKKLKIELVDTEIQIGEMVATELKVREIHEPILTPVSDLEDVSAVPEAHMFQEGRAA